MGVLGNAFTILVLATFTSLVFLFIGAVTDAAPVEVASTADAISAGAELARPSMPLEYAWILVVALLAIGGVHALFTRKPQGQV